MAHGAKKQIILAFEVPVPRPKLTKDGIGADRLAALGALRRELKTRGRPTPGSPAGTLPDDAWWRVTLPSGGIYKVPWFDEPLRAWSKAIGIPAKDMRDLLPVIRSAGKPELADAARGPESWPDEFAARRARVVGASDLVPVVVGTLAPQGGAVVGLTAELGAGGGRIVLRTRNGKKLEPWVYGVWSTRLASGDSNGTPDWRWVRGNGPALLKAVEQRPIATQAQQLLRGTWDAVMEYDASAGRVPVRVTLRRKVSGYATLFIQGPAAGSDWRFGWERGRAATKWWVTVNWEGEGEADSMEAAIREGLRRLLSEVISPSCSKRDTEKPH